MKKIHSLAAALFIAGLALAGAGVDSALALDPMRIQIRTALPPKIDTVGQAAQYFASTIGYRLRTEYPAPEESARIAGETLDPLAIANRIMPIEEAILSLMRPDYLLVVDNEHKLFSFEKGGRP